MNRILIWAAIAGLLSAASLQTHAEEPPKSATDNKSAPANPAAEPSLRKPGFIFMEFGTQRVEDYVSFFASVADFKEMYRKPGYVEVVSGLAELTFIDPKYWSNGHPFHDKLTGSGQGLGIEIGIVVADLDKAYAAAVKFQDKGWPISTGIVRRPWGVRDFRVLAPDGYYLRFTEGH